MNANMATMLDNWKTGHYGEDALGEPSDHCGFCRRTISGMAYDFSGAILCEDCYRDELFEVFHKEHEFDIKELWQ